MNKKNLLIFDFDKTLINEDSFTCLMHKTLTKEEKSYIYKSAKENWVFGYNYLLKKIKEHGISKDEFNNILEELSLSKGMQELFSYIKENKKNFEIIILSSNFEYLIKYILIKFNIIDIFSEIICTPSRENNPNEKEQFIYVYEKEPHNCNFCNPCIL